MAILKIGTDNIPVTPELFAGIDGAVARDVIIALLEALWGKPADIGAFDDTLRVLLPLYRSGARLQEKYVPIEKPSFEGKSLSGICRLEFMVPFDDVDEPPPSLEILESAVTKLRELHTNDELIEHLWPPESYGSPEVVQGPSLYVKLEDGTQRDMSVPFQMWLSQGGLAPHDMTNLRARVIRLLCSSVARVPIMEAVAGAVQVDWDGYSREPLSPLYPVVRCIAICSTCHVVSRPHVLNDYSVTAEEIIAELPGNVGFDLSNPMDSIRAITDRIRVEILRTYSNHIMDNIELHISFPDINRSTCYNYAYMYGSGETISLEPSRHPTRYEITDRLRYIVGSDGLFAMEPVRSQPGYWDNDQDYPVEDWILEVSDGDTRQSYAEWVEWQRELERFDRYG
jgi:hypothetical protein